MTPLSNLRTFFDVARGRQKFMPPTTRGHDAGSSIFLLQTNAYHLGFVFMAGVTAGCLFFTAPAFLYSHQDVASNPLPARNETNASVTTTTRQAVTTVTTAVSSQERVIPNEVSRTRSWQTAPHPFEGGSSSSSPEDGSSSLGLTTMPTATVTSAASRSLSNKLHSLDLGLTDEPLFAANDTSAAPSSDGGSQQTVSALVISSLSVGIAIGTITVGLWTVHAPTSCGKAGLCCLVSGLVSAVVGVALLVGLAEERQLTTSDDSRWLRLVQCLHLVLGASCGGLMMSTMLMTFLWTTSAGEFDAPACLRQCMATLMLFQCGITFGIFVIVSLCVWLGKQDDYAAGCLHIPAVIFFIVTAVMYCLMRFPKQAMNTVPRTFQRRDVWKRWSLALAVAVIQQGSGINAVLYLSPEKAVGQSVGQSVFLVALFFVNALIPWIAFVAYVGWPRHVRAFPMFLTGALITSVLSIVDSECREHDFHVAEQLSAMLVVITFEATMGPTFYGLAACLLFVRDEGPFDQMPPHLGDGTASPVCKTELSWYVDHAPIPSVTFDHAAPPAASIGPPLPSFWLTADGPRDHQGSQQVPIFSSQHLPTTTGTAAALSQSSINRFVITGEENASTAPSHGPGGASTTFLSEAKPSTGSGHDQSTQNGGAMTTPALTTTPSAGAMTSQGTLTQSMTTVPATAAEGGGDPRGRPTVGDARSRHTADPCHSAAAAMTMQERPDDANALPMGAAFPAEERSRDGTREPSLLLNGVMPFYATPIMGATLANAAQNIATWIVGIAIPYLKDGETIRVSVQLILGCISLALSLFVAGHYVRGCMRSRGKQKGRGAAGATASPRKGGGGEYHDFSQEGLDVLREDTGLLRDSGVPFPYVDRDRLPSAFPFQ